MNLKEHFLEIIESFVTSFVVVLVVYSIVASVEVVWGASMEPNFETNERILVDKVTKDFKDFKRGEVVVIIPPNDSRKHYIKRIIGLPGDIIKIKDCRVYINRDNQQFELQEDYLPSDTCTVGGPGIEEGRSVLIASDNYVVLGDNRNNSLDSRYFGVIKRSEVVGRVIFVFWPVNKAGFIN